MLNELFTEHNTDRDQHFHLRLHHAPLTHPTPSLCQNTLFHSWNFKRSGTETGGSSRERTSLAFRGISTPAKKKGGRGGGRWLISSVREETNTKLSQIRRRAYSGRCVVNPIISRNVQCFFNHTKTTKFPRLFLEIYLVITFIYEFVRVVLAISMSRTVVRHLRDAIQASPAESSKISHTTSFPSWRYPISVMCHDKWCLLKLIRFFKCRKADWK